VEQLTVVVGGQFGSEGKGAVTARLAEKLGPRDLNIRVAGPNAGHTAYDAKGRKYALRQIPIGAVTSTCQLGIAAGSEIDLEVLRDEIDLLDADGHDVSPRLWVHPSATIIDSGHKRIEQAVDLVGRVGSTGKGIGAARADRIMRRAQTLDDLNMHTPGLPPIGWPDYPFGAEGRDKVLIEGTQGYGLGLHTEFYPQVTSSDCRAIDFLAMAGISPWSRGGFPLRVWVVARVYPIRVAGNSGPLNWETTWADLGLPEERTTVTQKVRRVGSWDGDLVREAVAANGGHPVVKVALTMLDQMFPEVAGATEIDQLSRRARDWICEKETEVGAEIGLVGTSPTTMIELGDGEWEAQ
jgi:adenylosuccinate synthase